MKVLHLVKTGTGASWAVRQVRELSANGVEVHVALPDGPRVGEYVRAGAVVHVDDFAAAIGRPFVWRRRIARCAELVGGIAPDIVHSHFVTTTLTMRRALRGSPALRVFQVPGPLHLEHSLSRYADLLMADSRDWWIASCQWTRQAYLASGVEEARVMLSYYGLDLNQFEHRGEGGLGQELGLGPETPLIGMVAYMYRPKWLLGHTRGLKGHEDLIDAVALCLERMPDLRCVIVGGAWDGATRYEARVRRYAARRCGNSVIFLGPRADIANIYRSIDVAVHPSHSENLGGAAESMVMGVPTIATTVGGFPDLIRDGVTGWLTPPRQPKQLASVIMRALEKRRQARELADAGRNAARQLLDVRRTGAEVVQLYEKILDHAGRMGLSARGDGGGRGGRRRVGGE